MEQQLMNGDQMECENYGRITLLWAIKYAYFQIYCSATSSDIDTHILMRVTEKQQHIEYST